MAKDNKDVLAPDFLTVAKGVGGAMIVGVVDATTPFPGKSNIEFMSKAIAQVSTRLQQVADGDMKMLAEAIKSRMPAETGNALTSENAKEILNQITGNGKGPGDSTPSMA